MLFHINSLLYAQPLETYYHYNDTTNEFSSYHWLTLFANGRFELGYDDNELASIVQSGMYKTELDTLYLFEFQQLNSSGEILECPTTKADSLNNVNVHVVDANGLPINGVFVYLQTSSKNGNLSSNEQQTDSTGILTFACGQDQMSINVYITQKNSTYLPLTLNFEKAKATAYQLTITCAKNILNDPSYTGKVMQHPCAKIERVNQNSLKYSDLKFEMTTLYSKNKHP